MVQIGKFSINISALTSGLTKGLNLATKKIQGFSGTIRGSLDRLTRFGVIAGAAAVGGLALLVKNQFVAIDVMAKLSARLGIATSKLIGLRHAASLAGVESAALDKSLEQMVRRLGEVATKGSGEAKAGLDALGLSIKAMLALSPDQQFRVIAKGIRGLSTQAEKAAVAYQFFGRQGVALLNVLEIGAAGFDASQAAVERFGLTVSDVAADKIQKMNDSITDLKASVKGIAIAFAVNLADSIRSATTGITNLIVQSRSFFETIAPWVPLIGKVVLSIGGLLTAMAAIRVAQKAIAVGQAILLALVGPKGWAQLAAAAAIGAAAYLGVSQAFAAVEASATGATAAVRENAEVMDGQIATAVDGISDKMTRLQSEGNRVWESTRTSAEKYSVEVKRLGQMLKFGTISQETFNRAMEAAKKALAGTKETATKVAMSIGSIRDKVKALVDLEVPKLQLAGSATKGSQAAASAINMAGNNLDRINATKRITAEEKAKRDAGNRVAPGGLGEFVGAGRAINRAAGAARDGGGMGKKLDAIKDAIDRLNQTTERKEKPSLLNFDNV